MEWAAREALSWTDNILSEGGGGGGDSLSKPYRYVLPQMVGFLRRFALKTGIDFTHFGLGSVWFSSNYGSVRYLSFQFQMSKKEGEICEFKMD